MPSVRALIPFQQLIRRSGIPEMRVCRMSLTTQGVELAVGSVIAPDTFGRTRIRQLYEQRRIEPVVAPPDSRQEARERMEKRMERMARPATASFYDPSTDPALQHASVGPDLPDLPFDPPEVHAVEESHSSVSSQAKVAYRPSRGVKRP